MRHSDLALVLIRRKIKAEPHLVLIRNEKWADWTLVGGHVEPDEKNDWARAAVRECNEELAPLQFGDEFVLLPLLDEPIQWGPVSSKSAHGELTTYTAQLFALRFLKAPAECLSRLPPNQFRIVRESEIMRATPRPEGTVAVAATALGGLDRVALAWDVSLSSPPLKLDSLQA